MDTRNKILPLEEAAARVAAESLTPVQMDCDPLLATIAISLEGPLYAFVAERENAYLPVEARAQLAASLAAVRYVSIGEFPGARDLRPVEAAERQALENTVLRKSEVQ